MYVYPRYRPSLGLIAVSLFTVFLLLDPVKDLIYVILAFIQMACFYLSLYVEYRTHETKKGYYYFHLELFQNALKEMSVWEDSDRPVELTLKRYELIFGMFDSTLRNLYKNVYKKHSNQFDAILVEIDRLNKKEQLTYSDLSQLKLDIKTLIR